ncbi:hypothetical protein [Flavobacterium sp. ABG]|uniref:hypothetical protein n=1 Tax=Flavobacterium sp. ABG TaxID=1423322 RepID=UPI000649930D|nr:hypothetical protein [Flavobacterium sp. ABG]KLT68126.1 hypothetical protein AB674_19305 [Flavobacterium sp. ABG]
MKKKLEADLISIAHRILKLKSKSDINQLYLETQKLYEKLAVLKFVDENFDTLKPTIGRSEVESHLETIFEKEDLAPVAIETEEITPVAAEETSETAAEVIPDPEVNEETEEVPVIEIPEEEIKEPIAEIIEETATEEIVAEEIEEPIIETIVEPITATIEDEEPATEIISEEKVETLSFDASISEETAETEPKETLSFTTKSDLNPIPDFKPAFELTEEPEEKPKEETEIKQNPIQFLFEDFGVNYADAEFVKVDSFEAVAPTSSIPELKENKTVETVVIEKTETKATSLNEKLAKGFHVDLNDRIAFTKNLFGNSTEDYSRVLNQLLTFDSYGEAAEFIENMVKPDYNNWEGKDDYAQRFLEIVEKKFS